VKPRDQEYDSDSGDADTLEDTQRTGLEAELVLRVVGVPEKCNAGYEACEIE